MPLPSKGRCLQSHYLAEGLHGTICNFFVHLHLPIPLLLRYNMNSNNNNGSNLLL
jgi:hypothetical protein